MDDAFHAEVIVTRRPEQPREVLFECIMCNEKILKPERWQLAAYGRAQEREPICGRCTRHWGLKTSGPVFNRQNHHTLSQLSAMICCLEWEVRHGHRRHRY